MYRLDTANPNWHRVGSSYPDCEILISCRSSYASPESLTISPSRYLVHPSAALADVRSGTASDISTARASCPVIRASKTGAEAFRGLTRVVHLLRAGMWLHDEAEVVHFPGQLGVLVRRA